MRCLGHAKTQGYDVEKTRTFWLNANTGQIIARVKYQLIGADLKRI